MKKILFRISCFIMLTTFSIPSNAQLGVLIDAAKNYTDANIVNNNSRQVTPLKVNTSINKIIDALKFIDTDLKAWSILGNAGTVDAINFIGTTDNKPFNIRVNNQKAGRIESDDLIANTMLGYQAGNVMTGNSNTGIGQQALLSSTTGHRNTAVGYRASFMNTSGTDNTAIGNASLLGNQSGSKNVAVGYLTSVALNNITNSVAIGANAYVGASNSMVLGSINGVNSATENMKVGIGTTTPTERLHIVGNLRLVNGSQSAGRFLQTDANGVATWVDAPVEVGTVQTVSVVSTNGFSGTVANATTTPAITIQTTVTGLIKGNGTAISTATADVDYATPAYADAKVADAINDGVFAIAPSQNAVYDALTLKQNALGYTPENVANKENGTIDNNITKYPTVNLLKTGLDTKLDVGTTTTDIPEGTNQYFTSEKAQDATGSMVDATIVYNDGIPSLGRAAIDGDIAISAGSNTAAITAGVIVNADINAAAAIDATKLIDGSISNTELGYINTLTSNAQTQLNNKFTKGGDNDISDLAIGLNTAQNFSIKTDNATRMFFNTTGDVGIGTSNPLFKLHIWGNGGNGAGGIIGFGDAFGSDPRVSFGERGGADSDQGYMHANNGIFIGAGLYNSAIKMAIKSGGTIIGGETAVAGKELTVIGDADFSGTLTAGNILKGSAVLDFPSTNGGTSSELTIAVAGASVGDAVMPGIGTSNANSSYEFRISAANVLSVKFINASGVAINPASANFKYVVFK